LNFNIISPVFSLSQKFYLKCIKKKLYIYIYRERERGREREREREKEKEKNNTGGRTHIHANWQSIQKTKLLQAMKCT